MTLIQNVNRTLRQAKSNFEEVKKVYTTLYLEALEIPRRDNRFSVFAGADFFQIHYDKGRYNEVVIEVFHVRNLVGIITREKHKPDNRKELKTHNDFRVALSVLSNMMADKLAQMGVYELEGE